jgi:hypothetical protein
MSSNAICKRPSGSFDLGEVKNREGRMGYYTRGREARLREQGREEGGRGRGKRRRKGGWTDGRK